VISVAVVGAGAVGGYFGGRLAEAGARLSVLARGRTLEALRERGLRVESVDGSFALRPAAASDRAEELGPADYVLVGTKSWQLAEAARALAPLVGPETAVVPLLNGVEARDQLAEVLGPRAVLGGLCRILAWQEAPGVIRHSAVEPTIDFGEWEGGPSARVARLQQAFDACRGLRAHSHEDVQAAVWEKFLFIAPFGSVGALTRSPAGVFRSLPESRALLEGMMREVEALARARGVGIREDAVARTLGYVDALPVGATASMQRDLMEGRPSELDAQTGAIVRLGDAARVPVPISRVAYGALLPLEKRARGELQFPD
jgi:2-dehydropantoate 2-reductase